MTKSSEMTAQHIAEKNRITEQDKVHLRRCIELAREALEAGDEPFGSVLVDTNGKVLAEDRNRINSVEATYHPEIALARWAAKNMTAEDRANAVVYTSGEHCAMCSAAHALAGLGRIIYISSSQQLGEWMKEIGSESTLPINTLSIPQVAPNIRVDGPVPELSDKIKRLQQISAQRR